MLGFCHFSSSEHTGYRFGFNGMEKDDEVKGNGNHFDFGARGYDPRIGRWWSTDPLEILYPATAPYAFAGNSPIYIMDPDGKIKRDANGNIIATDNGHNTGFSQTLDYTRNKNGTATRTALVVEQRSVTIYTDKGTPVRAQLILRQYIETTTYDKNGVTKKVTESEVHSRHDATSNCHGYSVGDGNLWIDNDEMQKILDDEYVKSSGNGEVIVLDAETEYGDGVSIPDPAAHSGKVGSNGEINADAGILTPQTGLSLEQFQEGFNTTQTTRYDKATTSDPVNIQGNVTNGVNIVGPENKKSLEGNN